MNEIDWRIIQRMLIDAPTYDYDKKDKNESVKSTQLDFKEQTSEDLLGLFEKHLK